MANLFGVLLSLAGALGGAACAAGALGLAQLPAAASSGGAIAGLASAYLLGVALLGRGKDGVYAVFEVALLVSVAGAAGLLAATFAGAAQRWEPGALATLTVGACFEAALSVGFAIRLATQEERRNTLFVPGVVALTVVGIVLLILVTLGVS